MGLLDVATHQSNGKILSTLGTCPAQKLGHLSIIPEFFEITVCKNAADMKTHLFADGIVQHLVENLVIDLDRHEWNAVQAEVHHRNLPQRQADVVLAQLVDLWVAHTPLARKNQVN